MVGRIVVGDPDGLVEGIVAFASFYSPSGRNRFLEEQHARIMAVLAKTCKRYYSMPPDGKVPKSGTIVDQGQCHTPTSLDNDVTADVRPAMRLYLNGITEIVFLA